MPRNNAAIRNVHTALSNFKIELPSWGFSDSGTRFGKFRQAAAAFTTEEKFHDAGLMHKLTGACPTVAVHVSWDFDMPGDEVKGKAREAQILAAGKKSAALAKKCGVKIGAINPNVFEGQEYKLGSFCAPCKCVREKAMAHSIDSAILGKAVGSRYMSMWLADGTNYPGQDHMNRRKHDLIKAFKSLCAKMGPSMELLIEYKPFEPAFYHTDIADWGMSYVIAKASGKNAKVLVDTGHHLPGANIEHIVAFLLDEGMLGGFHFNDRKYADDDLEIGTIDPYGLFRIFDQIAQFEFDRGMTPGSTDIAYMVDQSHNLKPKLEAMAQTVMTAQDLFAKAQLVDRKALLAAQEKCDIVAAERVLRDAYETDIREVVADWRLANNLPADPLDELRASGITPRLAKERAAARAAEVAM